MNRKRISELGMIGHIDMGKSCLIDLPHIPYQNEKTVIVVGDEDITDNVKDLVNSGYTVINSKNLNNLPPFMQRNEVYPIINPYTIEGLTNSDNNYERKLPTNIDIYKEYQLILDKKSKLSKWERDKIINIINK